MSNILSQDSLAGVACLPFGLGRSYGDVCLLDQGVLLASRALNRYVAFDPASGDLTVESGVTISQILSDFLPRGWFLPTTPGTRWVSMGGAVANDVHGKNHERAGTLGCHVHELEIMRSNGEVITCSPTRHAQMFRATIGGLGLTGFVSRATVRLARVPSSSIRQRILPFRNLDEWLELSLRVKSEHEHTVSWVDGLASGPSLGRGLLIVGDWASSGPTPDGGLNSQERGPLGRPAFVVPDIIPSWLLSLPTVKLFNLLYRRRGLQNGVAESLVSFESFFYPLDALANWNHLYGPKGFYQWQGVVPLKAGLNGLKELLARVVRSRQCSPLTVLKVFGDRRSPGVLTFPMPGFTLAVDLQNKGPKTLGLLKDLDAIVTAHGGRVYAAKDGSMSPETFRAGYPHWGDMVPYIDPAFSSNFARRVGLVGAGR